MRGEEWSHRTREQFFSQPTAAGSNHNSFISVNYPFLSFCLNRKANFNLIHFFPN